LKQFVLGLPPLGTWIAHPHTSILPFRKLANRVLRGCRDRQVLSTQAEVIYMLGTILLIVLILLLIGAFPTWPHSRSWGYAPTGGIGIVVIVVIVLLVAGVI
jgi:hypothetical protein